MAHVYGDAFFVSLKSLFDPRVCVSTSVAVREPSSQWYVYGPVTARGYALLSSLPPEAEVFTMSFDESYKKKARVAEAGWATQWGCPKRPDTNV